MQDLFQEAGGHRVQRTPPTEKRGRVHTSSVTVAVFRETASNANALELAASDLRIEWFSGTGPGGQFRNKRQNSCRVIHLPSGLVETRQGRSREANRRDAIAALAQRLALNRQLSLHTDLNTSRLEQIGMGLRGEKIRTYRERDNRVVNHLNGKATTYRRVMKGHFSELWE